MGPLLFIGEDEDNEVLVEFLKIQNPPQNFLQGANKR